MAARVTRAIDATFCSPARRRLAHLPMVSLVWEVTARYGFNAPTEWAYDMTFMLWRSSAGLGGRCSAEAHLHRHVLSKGRAARRRVDLVCYPSSLLSAIAIAPARLGILPEIVRTTADRHQSQLPIVWPFKFMMLLSAVCCCCRGLRVREVLGTRSERGATTPGSFPRAATARSSRRRRAALRHSPLGSGAQRRRGEHTNVASGGFR